MKKSIFFYLLFLTAFLYGAGDDTAYKGEKPYFAGTLLAYSGSCYDPGVISIQPIILIANRTGYYDQNSDFQSLDNVWVDTFACTLQAGLLKYLDAQVSIGGSYTNCSCDQFFLWNDVVALVGMQLLESQKDCWLFNMRFLFGESFPTGKFSQLNIALGGNDTSGTGSYQSIFVLAADKLFSPSWSRPFIPSLNLYCIIPTPLHVSGISIYGGTEGTRGKVFPGKQFITNLSLQYSLSVHWAIGCDCNYLYQNASRFQPSRDHFGAPAARPSSYILSLAPGIEYTLNDDFSMLAGAWFSVAGRNTTSFVSGYFSLYYFF